MKLVLKRANTSDADRCGTYVQGLKGCGGLFNLTNELKRAKRFVSVPELLAFVAQHDAKIGNYNIVKVKHTPGWREVKMCYRPH